jgi:hypothetical protein
MDIMNAQSTASDRRCAAILIDTVSIQPYLFGSNKLRENIGASHIVGSLLYQPLLAKALETTLGDNALDAWRDAHSEILMAGENPPEWEIAFEGGGNAMLLFKSPDFANAFIRKFTLLVTANFPGLRVAIGLVADISIAELGSNFPAIVARLHQELAKARHLSHANNLLPKAGIMEDCPQSNEAATEQDGDRWIGLGTKAKLNAAIAAQSHWRKQFPRFAGTKFAFTSEIEKLGQPDDKGYAAIVHIDGNGMGKRFLACKSLAELRRLSVKVSQIAHTAMSALLDELVALLAQGSELREAIALKTQDDHAFLPLRPLWMGGDDVVFVCEGRLGIYLASRFIHHFCSLMNRNTPADPVSACAGVAIVKTKYPFYRAYKLAEDLMYQAKKASRANNASWLAFLVSSAGFNGSLDEILEGQYHLGQESLYGGPYCLEGSGPHSIRQLFQGIQTFEEWPRNKVMELRDVLVQSEDERAYFMVTLQNRGHRLPNGATTIDRDHIGTYMDMIHWLPFHLQPLSLCN